MIVNAAGPWVEDVLRNRVRSDSTDGVRLVRGSHIVTRRLFSHDKCYFFQGTDGRIMFAIPYETDFTLIGTTDQEHTDPAVKPVCTDAEKQYMVDFVNGYLKQPITTDDIVWSYSGVRPLHNDGAASASAATRDYTLKVGRNDRARMLNIYGGKITTYRRLAEHAMELIGAELETLNGGKLTGAWTAGVALPGGDFPVDAVAEHIDKLNRAFPFLITAWAARLIRAYGTDAHLVLGAATLPSDLGQAFGATLTAAEVDWLMEQELARTAEDVLWRRSKLGLRLTKDEAAILDRYMTTAPMGSAKSRQLG
jgi:glycerol-3-phosphate dehydrogenase